MFQMSHQFLRGLFVCLFLGLAHCGSESIDMQASQASPVPDPIRESYVRVISVGIPNTSINQMIENSRRQPTANNPALDTVRVRMLNSPGEIRLKSVARNTRPGETRWIARFSLYAPSSEMLADLTNILPVNNNGPSEFFLQIGVGAQRRNEIELRLSWEEMIVARLRNLGTYNCDEERVPGNLEKYRLRGYCIQDIEFFVPTSVPQGLTHVAVLEGAPILITDLTAAITTDLLESL
jgi:hypothetical protein